MTDLDIKVEFTPARLKAFMKNETYMNIITRNMSDVRTYWCECDVNITPPLSLSHDSEMNIGRTRVGILKPMGISRKQVKLYTRPNNFPDDYKIGIIAYIYDEEGAIAERIEHSASIVCSSDELAKNIKVSDDK